MPARDGIVTIDTGYVRPAFCAAYLVIEDGRAAFIDTGPGRALPRLLDALRGHGLGPEAVDWVIATHVHLDHAGAATSDGPSLLNPSDFPSATAQTASNMPDVMRTNHAIGTLLEQRLVVTGYVASRPGP